MLTLVAEHCNSTDQAMEDISLQPADLVEISNMRQAREVRLRCTLGLIKRTSQV